MNRLLALLLVTATLPVATPQARPAHDAVHSPAHTHAAGLTHALDLMEWLYGATCEDCGLRVGGLFRGGCRCVEFSGRLAASGAVASAAPLLRPALFAGDVAPRASASAPTD